ncbi:MAG TPA: bifunctional nuclease family protein [Acidimicrobiales bacterium]|nr:bifunctional nuclease family protein [Acidimicrobiales bacterium]
MREVQLVGVRIDLQTNTPIVLLEEVYGDRTLPIFIGSAEASAIAFAIEGVEVPRPMTHDLLNNILNELGAELVRAVISDVIDGTYYAELYVRAHGNDHVISARPSDAIALAIRSGSPMYIADALMDNAPRLIEGPEGEDREEEDAPEEIVDEFLEFLDNVRPEDFE